MLAAAETVIRVTQDTDDAVAFGLAAARVLEILITTNATGVEAVTAVAATLRDPARAHPNTEDAALAAGLTKVLGELSTPNAEVCMSIGQSCDYPFNLWTGSHLIAQLAATPADYTSGVRQTILAGGDSGSRGMFVGAAQAARAAAAAGGAIPAAWIAATTAAADVQTLAAQLVSFRPGSL